MSVKKYKTLAIYDVVETKRRNKLVKCLQHYLIRIQKSAFEGEITPKQCKTLAKNAGASLIPKKIYCGFTSFMMLESYTTGENEKLSRKKSSLCSRRNRR